MSTSFKSAQFKKVLASATILTTLFTTNSFAQNPPKAPGAPITVADVNYAIRKLATKGDKSLVYHGFAPTGKQDLIEFVQTMGNMNYTPEQLEILASLEEDIRSLPFRIENDIQQIPEGEAKRFATKYNQALKAAMDESIEKIRARYGSDQEAPEIPKPNDIHDIPLAKAKTASLAKIEAVKLASMLSEIETTEKINHITILNFYDSSPWLKRQLKNKATTNNIISELESYDKIHLNAETVKTLKKADLSKVSDDAAIAPLSAEQKAVLVRADMLLSASNPEQLHNKIDKIASQIVQAPKHNAMAFAAAVNHIVNRLSAVKIADSGLGTSAGDEKNNTARGAWVAGIFGASAQKRNGLNAGYKGRLLGATIGADVPVSDEVVLGLAYSNITSKLNYKQMRSGDKTTAKTHVFSMYGQFDNDEIVWTNIASMTNGRISNLRGRTSTYANSKIKNRGWGLETNLGYKIERNNITFVPNIGLKYTTSKDGAYKESGSGVHNLEFAARTNRSFSGMVGLNLMTSYMATDGIELIPGANISIENNFNKKAPSIKFRYTFTPDYVTVISKDKMPAVSYNAGISLLAKASNFEVGAAYNFNGMKKYSSHEGSLKLKVLF